MRRDTLLMAAFVAAAVALFVLTSFAARLFHAHHDRLGEEWYEKGEGRLQAGDAEGAIQALRNALLYHRDHFQYRMLLAQALLRSGHPDEARSYLLSLWQREPGHGVLNLELARLAAARGNAEEAVRYFHNAIHGLWPEQAEERRLQSRLELIRFLLDQQATEEARAQLMALSAEMPPRQDLLVTAGGLFLRAGDNEQALAQFEAALAQDDKHGEALLGAGQAAFDAGNYVAARRYLSAAAQEGQDGEAAQLLQTTELIFEMDPFRWRLGSQARAQRSERAFQLSVERLRWCIRQVGLEMEPRETGLHVLHGRIAELEARATAREMRRNPDLVEVVMEFAFEAQRMAELYCGRPEGPDLALLLLARQREAAGQ